MGEDSGARPLPRRRPHEGREPGTGRSATPLVLPEDVLQRIVEALGRTGAREPPPAPPAPPQRPAQEHQLPPQPPSPLHPSPLPPLVQAVGIGREMSAPAARQVRPSAAEPPTEAKGGRHRGIRRVTLAVVLLSAASLAFLLTWHAVGAPSARLYRTGAGTEPAIRDRAAAWVAGQVSRASTVSCDPVMCQALEAHGIPAASVLELRPGEADPLRSGVIVVTPAVRSVVGSRLIAADAPVAIASFGSGSGRIDVRAIAPRGAAAYLSALRADVHARKLGGRQLLDSPRVTMPATVRRQLAGGQVDSRLLVVIVSLAAHAPVSVAAFGDLPPGASPGVPLRSADLSAASGTARPGSARMRWMSHFLRAQRGSYRPAHITMVRLAGGRKVLRIEFPAPSPFGLLNTKAPGP